MQKDTRLRAELAKLERVERDPDQRRFFVRACGTRREQDLQCARRRAGAAVI